VPRAILGDHGGDLHGGVTRFCESHPNTTSLKAPYMNLASLLRWGITILSVLDQQPEHVIRHGTAERLEEKYGWLRAFRNDLALWSEYQTLLETRSMKSVVMGIPGRRDIGWLCVFSDMCRASLVVN
jgi:hypothetical protein